jgi:hypothetical protein
MTRAHKRSDVRVGTVQSCAAVSVYATFAGYSAIDVGTREGGNVVHGQWVLSRDLDSAPPQGCANSSESMMSAAGATSGR